jgi:uncharacterized Zn-binding protein involved in type VI secretion
MFSPAARITDMHVCPLTTGMVPHVGGPILPPGAPTVLIAGLAAARVSDLAACSGPPDTIVTGAFTCLVAGVPLARLGESCVHGGKIVSGCTTVLVGDNGSANGNPGVATMKAARATARPFVERNCAGKAAVQAHQDSPIHRMGDTRKKAWVELTLADDQGQPVPYERYRVTAPDGTVREGFLDENGLGRVDGIDPGTCKITFPDLDQDAWQPA